MEPMEQHGEPAAYGVYVLPWRVGGSLVVKKMVSPILISAGQTPRPRSSSRAERAVEIPHPGHLFLRMKIAELREIQQRDNQMCSTSISGVTGGYRLVPGFLPSPT